MKHLKKIFLLMMIACNTAVVFAQGTKKVEMADAMRSNGKIYIVVAVCLTILTGLFLYVLMLDRKISAFEKSSGESG